MPSTINSTISTIPTLVEAENSPVTAYAILARLECSLITTRNSLEKALRSCLAVEMDRTELARNPLYKTAMTRSLAENRKEYKELTEYLTHLRRDFIITDIDWKGKGTRPSDLQVAVGEEVRSRVWQVVKVQRRKERRVARMEELYAKEKDIAAGIVQVRAIIKKWKGERVLAKATGVRRRRA